MGVSTYVFLTVNKYGLLCDVLENLILKILFYFLLKKHDTITSVFSIITNQLQIMEELWM